MPHVGFRLGLGSGSEFFGQRRILQFIHQQSDDRWVDAEGKTSSRINGTRAPCAVCFEGRRIFVHNSARGSRSVRAVFCLLGWPPLMSQTLALKHVALLCGNSCLVMLFHFPLALTWLWPRGTPGLAASGKIFPEPEQPAMWCKRFETSGQMGHMTPDGTQKAWDHQS